MAGRGMATSDPLHNNVPGEMGSGDRVVVTHGFQWSPNQLLPGLGGSNARITTYGTPIWE
jgi:hypothetical protein